MSAHVPLAGRIRCALLGVLVLAPALAFAQSARTATVRIALHQRASSDPGATYVDIGVRGTEVPIRLVRRIAGSCVREADTGSDTVLARVACSTATGAVTFEVLHEGSEILVRRTPPASSEGASEGAAESQVVARATLPRRATVRVEP
jgi:hypothetical protein